MGYFVGQNVCNNYLNNTRMFNISFLETAAASAGHSSEVSLFPVVLMTLKEEQEPKSYNTSVTLATPNHVVVV